MKITYLLSDIQQKILQYNPVALVREITEQAWRIFLNKGDELERDHKNSNRFIRCAPWICFIAIGSDTRTLDNRLLKYKKINTQTKFKLSYKMEKLLSYKGLDPLASTFYHIEDNPIEDFRRRFEENIRSGKLESLKLDLQVKLGEYHIAYNVYDRLYIGEDVRRWNFEVEAKYSHLPLVRSMLIASQLSNYEELLLDGMPAKRFHQILNLIVWLFIECRGRFTQDKLYDLLQEKYKDRKSEVDIGSLKSDIDSLLDKLLCNDINASYKTFEKYLKKNFLYPPYYLNPFYTTPILSQEVGGIIEYFAPSPYILILCTGWLFWILVKDEINNNDLGTALHNYISAFLNHYKTIHNIDIIDLDKSNGNNSRKDLKKKADFVVETEHYKIIINAKIPSALGRLLIKTAKICLRYLTAGIVLLKP